MPTNQLTADHLTRDHFYVFGYIVSTYAKIETGFKLFISGVLGVEFHVIAILSEPYTAHQLQNITSTVANTQDLTENTHSRILEFTRQFHTLSKLRNNIAHSMWVEGKRPGSIKPIHMRIGKGTPKLVGIGDTERDYTLEELHQTGADAQTLHDQLTALLLELDFAPDIAENT